MIQLSFETIKLTLVNIHNMCRLTLVKLRRVTLRQVKLKVTQYNYNQKDILAPDVIQHFHTGRFNTMVTKTPISPKKQHGVHEPTFFNFNPPSAQSTTTVTLPFGWPNCFKLQLTLESTQKLTRFVQPPSCRGPTPCFSAHFQLDAAWLSGQHSARPQADGHHAEGPLRQGAPRDQGPRRTLALGINLGAGTVLCPACCGRLISRCPLKFQTRPMSTSCRKVVPERENIFCSILSWLEPCPQPLWIVLSTANSFQRDGLCPGGSFPSNKLPYNAWYVLYVWFSYLSLKYFLHESPYFQGSKCFVWNQGENIVLPVLIGSKDPDEDADDSDGDEGFAAHATRQPADCLW